MTARLQPTPILADAYPLSWPAGWPRTKPGYAQRARFFKSKQATNTVTGSSYRAKGATTIASSRDEVVAELRRLGATEILISSNLRRRKDGEIDGKASEPADPGVAVYFRIKGEPRVLACDKWSRVADNLRALALHVDAIRGQLRWGAGSIEQAFGGYRALPAMDPPKQWFEVLGVSEDADARTVDKARLDKLAACHPDKGGKLNDAIDVNVAYDQYRRARAGEAA